MSSALFCPAGRQPVSETTPWWRSTTKLHTSREGPHLPPPAFLHPKADIQVQGTSSNMPFCCSPPTFYSVKICILPDSLKSTQVCCPAPHAAQLSLGHIIPEALPKPKVWATHSLPCRAVPSAQHSTSSDLLVIISLSCVWHATWSGMSHEIWLGDKLAPPQTTTSGSSTILILHGQELEFSDTDLWNQNPIESCFSMNTIDCIRL